MRPLVSILIPAYNAEKWIADTIQSAVTQTWAEKEIIVVDDGSTDATLAVARRFESPSVRIVSQRNQGAAAARNRALSLSRGDYIQWLDADDLLACDKIARQMEVLGQTNGREGVLATAAWGQFMSRPGRAQFIPTALWCDLSPTEFLVRKIGQKLFMQTAAWLVSRELTESAGAWDTSLLSDDDGEYFCRVLLRSKRVQFVPEARVYYRWIGPGSLSYVGRSDRKLEAMWRGKQLHMGYVRSLEDSGRVRAACVRYLQNYLIDFYPARLDIVRQMHQAAEDLGGRLEPPRLSWKYAWIRMVCGWDWAQRAQISIPVVKWSLLGLWDRSPGL